MFQFFLDLEAQLTTSNICSILLQLAIKNNWQQLFQPENTNNVRNYYFAGQNNNLTILTYIPHGFSYAGKNLDQKSLYCRFHTQSSDLVWNGHLALGECAGGFSDAVAGNVFLQISARKDGIQSFSHQCAQFREVSIHIYLETFYYKFGKYVGRDCAFQDFFST